MRHRHNGTYRSRTPKGKTTYKKRPIHSQMEKYKTLNYRQLRKKFRINPILDDDGDGVKNYKDCRPWDKKRQDEDEYLEEDIEEQMKEESEKKNFYYTSKVRNEIFDKWDELWDRYKEKRKQEGLWPTGESVHAVEPELADWVIDKYGIDMWDKFVLDDLR